MNVNNHTGFSALNLLDSTLQQMRSQLHEVDGNAEKASQRLVSLSREESNVYSELGRLKAEELKDLDLAAQRLSSAEQHAHELLTQRERAIVDLASEIERSLEQQTNLELQRRQQGEQIEQAAIELHSQISSTHARLATNADYVEARDLAQAAVDRLVAATEKTDRAKTEHQSKANPYQGDRIFMYLWDRGYGTQAYRAGKIIRLLDRWVSDHVGFESARRNYWMLLEIPKRLAAHVDELQAQADALMGATEAIERSAETADGVTTLEDTLEALREKLRDYDNQIETTESHYRDKLARRDSFAAATDAYFKEAIETLAKSFRTHSIHDLQRAARATEGYEDDSLVSQLAQLHQQIAAMEQRHRVTKRASGELTKRLHELENLRRTFKQRGFDAPNSQFNSVTSLSTSINDFTQGLITSAELWRTFERSQHFIRRQIYPNYGNVPSAIRLPRGIRIPSNWGGGGGGFRGPSGGGGFGTGGGF